MPPPPAVARPTPPPPPPAAKVNGAVNGSKRQPPTPPVKRPAKSLAGATGQQPQARDSTLSLGQGTDSGRSTPSLAGGLAEALRARQSAMKGKRDSDDDDDW